ncbi:hypothetical protein STEG23_031986 [Scotinomys teguina]
MRLFYSFCRANEVQRELSIVSLAEQRTMDPENTGISPFDSIQEGIKNGTSSYINTLLLSDLSIVSLPGTKEPWILETRVIKHSELGRNKRTVDPRNTSDLSIVVSGTLNEPKS